jgi:type IX secretion system PorP/SprF family membrane protein
VTQFANLNTYFGKRNGLNHAWHGVGFFYQGDRMGKMIQTDDYYASYTLLLRIDRKGYIAFGLAAGARSYSFAPPLQISGGVIDPAIIPKQLWLYPDFIPGIKFWNNKWSFDLSVKQLYKYKAQQGGDKIGTNAQLHPTAYFAVSRKWWPRSWLLVLQSLYVKYDYSSLPSVDYNMLAYLNKNFAVGVSYRHLDAIAGVFQFRFDKLVIGLAYDYTIAPYRFGAYNTQEFMLGLAPSPYYGGASEMKKYRTAECPQFQY